MSKISEFYAKVSEDEALKQEIATITGDKVFDQLSDEQIRKVSELATRQGYAITVEDAKDFFGVGEEELSLEALDAVAGGKKEKDKPVSIICGGRGAGATEAEVGKNGTIKCHGVGSGMFR